MPRVLLLLASTTYRAEDFMQAASRLGVDVVVGSDQEQALAQATPGTTLELDFNDPAAGVRAIQAFDRDYPLDAIIAAEDDGALLAAEASRALRLPHNSPDSVALARYKHRMRDALARADVAQPTYRVFNVDTDSEAAARTVEFPCVLKPVLLAASRGVIRADDPEDFVRAFHRIRTILQAPDVQERADPAADLILVERFIAGDEVAVEGLLEEGELRVLALFDKPDPLQGPYFEETLYVTPSRLTRGAQDAVRRSVAETTAALGLHHGPVHAELRINEAGIFTIEIAPRSIGGLCSRTLRFGAGISLEELIIRHATGMDVGELTRERRPAGVMMIPIPARGTLRAVSGLEEAESLDGIEGVTISIPLGGEIVPLPEGRRYLGFVFARADTPERVERALREAGRRLEFEIESDRDR